VYSSLQFYLAACFEFAKQFRLVIALDEIEQSFEVISLYLARLSVVHLNLEGPEFDDFKTHHSL
jgi:hypothetical protein